MPKSKTKLALTGITAINLLVVAASSIFGVYGDGSPGIMPWVLVIGFLWVLAFTYRATVLIGKDEHGRGLGFAARSIPYAFIVFILGFYLWTFIRITWF